MKQLIYKARPGYNSRNRCSFNRFPKVSRDGAEVTSAGSSFHMRAPATGKARCPIVGSLTTGTHSYVFLLLDCLLSWRPQSLSRPDVGDRCELWTVVLRACNVTGGGGGSAGARSGWNLWWKFAWGTLGSLAGISRQNGLQRNARMVCCQLVYVWAYCCGSACLSASSSLRPDARPRPAWAYFTGGPCACPPPFESEKKCKEKRNDCKKRAFRQAWRTFFLL